MKNIMTDPPWMRIAAMELGVCEIAGNRDSKRIMEYLKGVGNFAHDETAWCSAFINWVMRHAGILGTGRANARSWLQWGVALDEPEYGAITVLWRNDPKGWQGHVAFYLCDSGDYVRLLGGNQGNAVTGMLYPRSRVLGYRWPVSPDAADLIP